MNKNNRVALALFGSDLLNAKSPFLKLLRRMASVSRSFPVSSGNEPWETPVPSNFGRGANEFTKRKHKHHNLLAELYCRVGRMIFTTQIAPALFPTFRRPCHIHSVVGNIDAAACPGRSRLPTLFHTWNTSRPLFYLLSHTPSRSLS